MPKNEERSLHVSQFFTWQVLNYAARFSLELAIRVLKGFFGLGDDQTTFAFCRFVLLSGVACCLCRLWLHQGHVEAWRPTPSHAPVSETRSSFAR